MARGVRPKCVAEQGEAIDAPHCGDWQPAIEALRLQLENEIWHNANVRIVVSDHWTRYAVLPWSAELSNRAERMSHAKHILHKTYGDVADEWTIRLSSGAPKSTSIISAIPSQLLDELHTLFSVHKHRLISLQPQLLVAYNSWRDKIPASAAWFASIDEGSLAALHVTNGRWDRVRSVRISDDWSVEMRRMQTMGRLANSRPAEGRVFVDAPIWLRESADKDDAALEWLEDKREPQNIADKVSLLKGMYA
jgi:hypothetical protein